MHVIVDAEYLKDIIKLCHHTVFLLHHVDVEHLHGILEHHHHNVVRLFFVDVEHVTGITKICHHTVVHQLYHIEDEHEHGNQTCPLSISKSKISEVRKETYKLIKKDEIASTASTHLTTRA